MNSGSCSQMMQSFKCPIDINYYQIALATASVTLRSRGQKAVLK